MKSKSNTLNVTGQPRLRRRLFGVRTRDVWAALDDREEELGKIRHQGDSARSEATTLRGQISTLEEKLQHAEQELAARDGSGQAPERSGDEAIDSVNQGKAAKFCACPPSEDVLEEMTRVVQVTEESTQRILQHARDTLMKEIEAAEALREQARSEISEASAWRKHWAPILRAFQTTVSETGTAIQEIPDRVREALAPLTAAAAALDEDLRQFAAFEITISMPRKEIHTDEEEPPPEAAQEPPIVVDEGNGGTGSDGEPVVITGEPDPATAQVAT